MVPGRLVGMTGTPVFDFPILPLSFASVSRTAQYTPSSLILMPFSCSSFATLLTTLLPVPPKPINKLFAINHFLLVLSLFYNEA